MTKLCPYCKQPLYTNLWLGNYCPKCDLYPNTPYEPCPTCNGTGEGLADKTRCPSCNGSGVERPTLPGPDEPLDWTGFTFSHN
jgi:hypothetical protein